MHYEDDSSIGLNTFRQYEVKSFQADLKRLSEAEERVRCALEQSAEHSMPYDVILKIAMQGDEVDDAISQINAKDVISRLENDHTLIRDYTTASISTGHPVAVQGRKG